MMVASLLKLVPALVLLPAVGLANPLRVQVIDPPVALRATEVATAAHLGETLSLRIRGSAGEVVTGSFVVVPVEASVQEPGRPLQIQWTALEGVGGVIDRTRVSVRVVKHWFQGGTAWSSIATDPRRLYVPELLLNDDGLIVTDKDKQRNYLRTRRGGETQLLDVSANQMARTRFGEHWLPGHIADSDELGPVRLDDDRFRQLWVNVTIPHDAKPGLYAGQLQLEAGGNKQASSAIEVEVLPFGLAASPLEYVVYYRGKLSFRTEMISSEWKSQEQMLQELQNIREHQIENATIYQPDDRLDLLEKVLSLRQQAGLANTRIYYLGFPAGAERTALELERMLGRVRRLVEVFKRHGAAEIYFYGVDEATGAKLAGESVAWSRVRSTGAKIYAAGKAADAGFFAEHADTAVLAYAPDPEVAKRIHAAGARVFSYNNPQTGPENPLLFRRNYGVELWRAGYDGALLYAYQHGFGAIYNDFDDPEYRDHVFAYPTSNGVIDTLAWEGMREAITDVRYLATLEHAIESFPASPAAPDVVQAREFLRLVKLRGASDLNAMRRTAATLLVGLSQASRRSRVAPGPAHDNARELL